MTFNAADLIQIVNAIDFKLHDLMTRRHKLESTGRAHPEMGRVLIDAIDSDVNALADIKARIYKGE